MKKAIVLIAICGIAGCQRSRGTSTSASTTATAPATTPTPTPTPSATASVTTRSMPSIVVSASATVDASRDHGLGLGLGPPAAGGCPCGCDHSEDMVDELRGQDPAKALASIDESLHTIGEREDAGYITERMVQHRLRLLAYASEIGHARPARFTSIPAPRVSIRSTTTSGLRVRADLMVHGETTELVRGKEKALHASFVLRFDLENESAMPITLRVPTLEGTIALPVSRWYLAGGDGERWNGALRIGEKAIVYVIGYLGEPALPGTEIAATVSFESLTIPVKTRARSRWNEML